MPLQNRVTPLGDVVAAPGRGLVYGNRGCIHDASGRIARRSATRRWIACRLEYRGWYRSPVPRPGKYTGLFFLDDATALAAGHRACALCRREDYRRVLEVTGARGADELDERLEAQRSAPRADVEVGSLPAGSFVLEAGEPHVVLDGTMRRWTAVGYGPPAAASRRAALVTPPMLVEVLRNGWEPLVPFLHPSAGV
jgi:hypothetical protein